MNRIRTASVAVLLASVVGLLPVPAQAKDKDKERRDKYEDRWDRRDRREDQWERREARWERREDRKALQNAYNTGYWDASRNYRRDDSRYRAQRLGYGDRIYRGSDDRYYCKRDDGTTGLIVGGIAGGVLGQIIAPGGYKTLGAIIGAGGGALLGRAIDDGDVVCK